MTHRLLEQITPLEYHLVFDIDVDNDSYLLAEKLIITTTSPSNSLVFHGVNFHMSEVYLDDAIMPISIKSDQEYQTVTFNFREQIPAGTHQLELKITNTISETLHGLYRSNYTDGKRDKKLFVSQFEASHAREAFLSIDEPAAKAIFEISTITTANLLTLSNADVIREISLSSGRLRRDFAATPPMSTYLVAMVIGEFEYLSIALDERRHIRVFATPGNRPQLKFALQTAKRALEFYENYFAFEYPLTKLDIVAIPDFAAGAMENWGLITCRETTLLLNDHDAALGNYQRVAEVIVHEIAHQWFGNLVTMDWWNDLWLNEGFATWMEVLAQDKLFPDWRIWEQFLSDHYSKALELDSLTSSHPLDVTVEDPRQIDELFDAVAYGKGAAIINMLHSYLGAEAFRSGIQNYIKHFAYGNCTTADLWQALENASDQPVVELMTAWTNQSGYPIISLSEGQIHQQRFLRSNRDVSVEPEIWNIPVKLLLPNGTIVNESTLKTTQADLDHVDFIKPNPEQTGFYRVDYSPTEIQKLIPLLKDQKLEPMDRFGVIGDVFAAAEAGILETQYALEMAAELRLESNYLAANELRMGLNKIIDIVDEPVLRQELIGFLGWHNRPNYLRLGWDANPTDSYFDNLLRPEVLHSAIRFGDADAIDMAKSLFAKIQRRKNILADIRPAIYYGVARHGDQTTYNQLLKLYRQATNPQERMRLLGGLCRFREPDIIDQALQLSISADVRPQDTVYVLAWSFSNRDARDQTWAFVKRNWPLFLQRYGNDSQMLESIPRYAGKAFANDKNAQDIEAFFRVNPHPGINRSVTQAVENIRIRDAWYQRDQAKISDFLDLWSSKNLSN